MRKILRQRVTRRKKRKGGAIPAFIIPALMALGKAVALGGTSAAAGHVVKKGLKASNRKKRQRHRR